MGVAQDECEYEVEFPASVITAASVTLERQGAETAVVKPSALESLAGVWPLTGARW